MAFIPQELSSSGDSTPFLNAENVREVADIYGLAAYRDAKQETLLKLKRAIAKYADTERLAAPLRTLFQSSDESKREQAHSQMEHLAITESDLCTAWHHLPQQRREHIRSALAEWQSEGGRSR